MNSKRVFYLMIAVVSLLVLGVIGTAYLANSMLEKQAGTLAELKLKSQVLEQEQVSLDKAKRDIAKYAELDKIAKSIVPQDKDQAQAVREIIKIASDSGIKPSSITFPTSSLGTTAAPTAGGTAGLTQLKPVKGSTGLYIQQITITQDASAPVPYDRFIGFLDRLEQNRRTAQVSNIVLQPQPQNRNLLSFTLTLDQYIKP